MKEGNRRSGGEYNVVVGVILLFSGIRVLR